jgi:hypothetical protein
MPIESEQFNRGFYTQEEVTAMVCGVAPEHQCVGQHCMAWRWHMVPHTESLTGLCRTEYGYCGNIADCAGGE